ncbi:MAG: TlpA disulfide reductase family protein [Solirubrobacteraceae bacterium]
MRWVVIGVAALLVGLLAYGVAQQDAQTTTASALQPGETPPEAGAKLPALGAETEGAVADYRGKVVLVNFWASWCPPCTDELPMLERAQASLEREGATVLGITTRDNSEDALAFQDRYGLTFPSLRDGGGDIGEAWGVAQLPESFLLDRDGKVAAVVQGPVTQEFIDEQVIPLAKRS